jgi:hypothetical protein
MMRSIIYILIVATLALAASHQHGHAHDNVHRDVETKIITDTVTFITGTDSLERPAAFCVLCYTNFACQRLRCRANLIRWRWWG